MENIFYDLTCQPLPMLHAHLQIGIYIYINIVALLLLDSDMITSLIIDRANYQTTLHLESIN